MYFSVYRILAIPTVVTHCSHVCRTWRLHSQAMKCCISLVTVMWGIMMAGRGQQQLHRSSNVLISTNNITAVHTLRRSQSFDFYVYNGIKRMVRVPESWFMNMSSKYFKHRLFFQLERGRVGRWWSGDPSSTPKAWKFRQLISTIIFLKRSSSTYNMTEGRAVRKGWGLRMAPVSCVIPNQNVDPCRDAQTSGQ